MPQNVLLTGANGYVGSHILSTLLLRNFSVTAVVRSQSKASQVLANFPNYAHQLSFAFVPDISTPGAYDKVVVADPPFDCVIHTASPFLYRAVKSNAKFLTPAINGTKEILSAIHRSAPTVKRVVITSSSAAVVDFISEAARPLEAKSYTYTEADWNPVTYEMAMVGPPNLAYQASKKFAELAGKFTTIDIWSILAHQFQHGNLLTRRSQASA